MKITLQKLTLTNFKGAKSLTVDFSDRTNIKGRNGSMKSTMFDGFTWLLFGKNSNDKKDFEIKTLDSENNPIPKIDHEAEGILTVDGMENRLRRCFREKWTKPKGQPEAVLSGHETLYWHNDVPLSMAEYKAQVDLICNESIFKLITNPSVFTSLNWMEQRKILFEMAGQISDHEVFAIMEGHEKEIINLVKMLESGLTLGSYKRQIAEAKKKLSKELKEIPTRIDEIHRGMPEAVDTVAINKLISDTSKEIESIETEINDFSARNESVLKQKSSLNEEIYSLKGEVRELEFEDGEVNRKSQQLAGGKARGIEDELKAVKELIGDRNADLSINKSSIVSITEKVKSLGDQWRELNAQELKYDSNEFSCPACKRDFETEDIDAKKAEMEANFNTDKQRRLLDISTKGKSAKAEKDFVMAENEELEVALEAAAQEASELTKALEEEKNAPKAIRAVVNPEIAVMNDRIAKIQDQINSLQVLESSDLTAKKNELQDRLTSYKRELSVNDQIDRAKERVSELEAQAKTLGQDVADIESTEFTMDEFTRIKIESVESKINAKFKNVKFKMYNQLINGGQEETCQALINGVPYSDANNAARINAGLDIINALSNHYDVYAPIFIDNAEAVNEIIETNTQVVSLIVTTDEKLTIENVKSNQNAVTV